MNLETIRRRRAPIGAGLLLLAVWIGSGIHRIDPEDGAPVLDSPLGFLSPRPLEPGWRLAPPGLLRITLYPVRSATYAFRAGSARRPLVSREGIEVAASGTIHYRVDPDRLLEVHRALGPRFERDAVAVWVLDGLRAAVGSSSYSDISGARTVDLSRTLGATLADRFRAAGLVLLSCDVGDLRIRAGEAGAASERRATGQKVLLIGLDGADWNVLDPLFQAGRLPNLARLAREGVRGRLRSITPMLSPVIWTSVATGVVPGRHGIIDFLATGARDGERVPVTSGLRKVKAIWNILSERGITVGVVGWWATYPAERVNGFIVSDRVAYQLFGARVAADQPREGKVFPPDADGLVVSLTVAPETIGANDVSRYVRLPADPASLPADQNKLIDDFKTLLAAGDTYARIGVALQERYRPDFHAFYLEGTDTVAHLFMRYTPPLLPGVDPEAAQRFGRAVDEYYRHADELVGQALQAAGPGTAVIVCSDHGFRTGENRPLTDPRIGYGQAADWHRKFGVVILHGPPFRKGKELEEASVLDLTPTILALFGLPVAEDMDGRPITDAFDPGFLAAHPISYVPTYEGEVVARSGGEGEASGGPAAGERTADPQGDRELKEKLQSLGYLRQDTANSHNNRGMVLMGQAKYDEAIGEFKQALDSSEDLAIARINIARAHYKKKDYAAAVASLEEFLAIQPRSKEAENLLGNIAMEQGRLPEAEGHFRRALEYEPNFTDARNSLGILHDRLGRTQEAIREFRRVIEIDPEYAEAYNNIGVIYKKQGKIDEAVAIFKKAIAADAEFAGSYSNLALVYEDRGDLKAAGEQFRRALEKDARNVAVRTNYGALLYLQGRLEDARRELEAAVAIDPSYASAHNNLGAVYGRLGRPQDEIAAYRRAASLDPNYADVHHNLGLALLKAGATKEGEEEMRRALAIDPTYAAAYLNLGRSFLDRGKTQEAAELLVEGVKQSPRNADLHAMLGEAALGLGRTEMALASFRRSLEIRPDQPDLRRRAEELAGAAPGPGATPSPGATPP
jgi:Tfp pilus assembly protein PilF